MNVLILSWRGPGHPHAGGAEVSTHEHAKGWVKMGNEVTLFTSFFQGAKKEELIDGVRIIRCGSEVFGVQLQAFFWYLFFKKEKFDLVIDQFHGIPFFTPIFVREKKLGFIHEVAKEVWKLNSWPKPYNLFPAIFGTIFEPLIFQLFYKNIPFMTVSESTKSDLISWGISRDRITVVHNGVIVPKKIHLFEKEKTKTLIFLGAISRDKGIEDALKIFSLLKQTEGDKWRFWVVGKAGDKYLKQLKLLIKKLQIEKQTTLYGYVNENKKFELLSKAHLLITPSVREGWGLVVIEAGAVGTPTVGYNVPGLRDSIVDGKTGILCMPAPEGCVKEIIALMKDTKKYKTMQVNCKKWSERFKWVKAVSSSIKIVSKVMKD